MPPGTTTTNTTYPITIQSGIFPPLSILILRGNQHTVAEAGHRTGHPECSRQLYDACGRPFSRSSTCVRARLYRMALARDSRMPIPVSWVTKGWDTWDQDSRPCCPVLGERGRVAGKPWRASARQPGGRVSAGGGPGGGNAPAAGPRQSR